VISGIPGQDRWVDDSTAPRVQGEPQQQRHGDEEPEVVTTLDGDVATLSLGGELTEDARRPLVRTMTDLLLGRPHLRQVRLDLREVTYLNSAGVAVLVQLQRLGRPRGVDVVLVAPPPAVARPLQLSGLWLRFTVEQSGGVDDRVDREGGS
jgi:anti-anti-sigma factor